jgi:hypothetical protein
VIGERIVAGILRGRARRLLGGKRGASKVGGE